MIFISSSDDEVVVIEDAPLAVETPVECTCDEEECICGEACQCGESCACLDM